MVLGAPGSGKSTFLKRVALEAFKGKKGEYKHSLIPSFIELKRFNQPEINIAKIIAKELSNCGFTQSQEYVITGLELGKFLIVLDGLDEVPTSNLELAIKQINEFVNKYQKNRFIISCRIALKKSFTKFTEVVIADFDNKQIEKFIANWFQSPQDKQAKVAEKCWQLLQANKNAKELAKTPLLLTFLCLVYEKGQSFPDNRSELYGKALRILLEEWASEKRIEQNKIYRGLNRELEEIILSEIAYNNFVRDKLFFPKEAIIQTIESFPTRNINAPAKLNGEAVLNAIALQQGILVERAADIYAFSHLTLQEYLTAQYIKENNLIEDLVSNHLTDNRWQEVWLLVAGLMRGGADKLLLLMEQEARNYLQTPIGKNRLVPLLEWAEKITKDSTGDIKPVAKRAIANVYANALDIANALANDIDIADLLDESIDYSQKLQQGSATTAVFTDVDFSRLTKQLEALKDKIPDDKQSMEIKLKFIKDIRQLWLDAFQLTPELIDLSFEEAQEIDNNYFYINWLIIQCKQAAVNVSPETWQEIEDKMLRV